MVWISRVFPECRLERNQIRNPSTARTMMPPIAAPTIMPVETVCLGVVDGKVGVNVWSAVADDDDGVDVADGRDEDAYGFSHTGEQFP